MDSFDELLAGLIEDEPEEVLGILADIVNKGRLQAEHLPPELLETLAQYELVAFLISRAPRQPLRTWVYPTPLGLRVFATLEREAERLDRLEKPTSQGGSGSGSAGVPR